ncbi:regulator of microtubule dynamics protein 1-like isoform X2 [Acropora palmata]|uniref:regulator of microtubule dynamics protein 1-like isoform X2 n=1 Tax=Acropora palmata TaxID=6131 RepID=UPI003D9FF1D4
MAAVFQKIILGLRMRTLLPGERLVTRALQQIKVLKLYNRLVRRPHPSKIIPPFVAAIGWFGASKSEETAAVLETKSSMSEMENDFKKADDLYDNNELQKAYDLLMKYKEPQKCEVEWRLAKVKRMMAEESHDSQKKKELIYEAFDHVKLALSLDEKNFAVHKWYAIILSCVGEYEGTKAKLQNAPLMKEHFEKAIELNPSDATSRHVLGVWCFTFADMGWVTRKLAATLFASPPSSSYEEALGNFQKAEELEPNFYSKNHLFLGKTLLHLKKMDEAKVWLERAVNDNPWKTADDKTAKKEAEELLRKYF